jgi:hypothetical protein
LFLSGSFRNKFHCWSWNRYQNKFHIGGINFPMKYVPGTNFSFKMFRQNKIHARTNILLQFPFTMHFILIKPVFSDHLSYVTKIPMFHWKFTLDRFDCICNIHKGEVISPFDVLCVILTYQPTCESTKVGDDPLLKTKKGS